MPQSAERELEAPVVTRRSRSPLDVSRVLAARGPATCETLLREEVRCGIRQREHSETSSSGIYAPRHERADLVSLFERLGIPTEVALLGERCVRDPVLDDPLTYAGVQVGDTPLGRLEDA